jgi:pescadillo protein
VCGETVHWLVPHALAQLLPADVDYRVMLTFLEFDEALLGFVNFRLYHSLQLPYPPAAAAAAGDEGPRLAPLVAALAAAKGEAALSELRQAGEDDASELFRGLVFSLGRETHTEVLSLLVLSCGGGLAGVPDAPGVTHAVVDRPHAGLLPPGVAAVQPQWLFDSLNFRLRCPEAPYAPGQLPPPHLSPFVDNTREGHVPDFAETVAEWQAAARGAAVAGLALAGEPAAAAVVVADTNAYASELAAEFAGVPYSAAAEAADGGEEEAAEPLRRVRLAQQTDGEEEAEAAVLSHVLLPRKQKELYKAMSMGRAKRAEKSAALKAKVVRK